MSYNSRGARIIFLMETALSSHWRQATCCCHGANSVPFNYHWPLRPRMRPCHMAASSFHSPLAARTAASPQYMAAASAGGLSSPSSLIPHGFPALSPKQKCCFAAHPMLPHFNSENTNTELHHCKTPNCHEVCTSEGCVLQSRQQSNPIFIQGLHPSVSYQPCDSWSLRTSQCTHQAPGCATTNKHGQCPALGIGSAFSPEGSSQCSTCFISTNSLYLNNQHP